MILKNFGRFLVAIWSVITDHLETIYRPMTLKNFGRFFVAIWSVITDHLETIYRPMILKKIWLVFGRNLVGNYRPFGDHLPTKFFQSINGRKIVGNGLSVNGR